MMFRSAAARAVQLFLIGCVSLFAQEIPAPPPAPPAITNETEGRFRLTATAAQAPALFSIGDPTDEEQLYLELINRARIDAVAEAERLIALDDVYVQTALELVDTNLMKTQFATNPPAAPLSFHAKLLKAARDHTKYQFDIGEQTHVGPGTNTLRERLIAVSYPFALAAENVYVYAQNPEHGHAGFEVDWSGGTVNGGMQLPPGHRNNNHNRSFNEIGIGVLNGTNQVGGNFPVGPQLLTQDFGRSNPTQLYVTGVAYYDLNGNNFYDIGEGLSGVPVTVDGVTSYAITAQSGGYSVPVSGNKTHTVRFKPASAAEIVTTVNITTNNAKLDYKPVFAPSILTSKPSAIFAGSPNLITFSSLAGASGYRVRLFNLITTNFEGAEGPLTNVTLTTFGNYPAISTESVASGSKSFHLGHITDTSNGFAYPQLLQLNTPFWVRAGAKIDFMSRLGIAFAGIQETQTNAASGPGEVARVEVSADEGKTWTEIWSQPGAIYEGGIDVSEGVFFSRSASLAAYAGKFVMIRFNFDVDETIGWFEIPPADNPNHKRYGWYVDDIRITGADVAASPTFINLDGSAMFPFTPTAPGGYLMQFAATAGARVFPSGPFAEATAVQGTPPVFSFTNNTSVASGVVSMHVTKLSGTTTSIAIYGAPSVAGPWSRENGATITGPTGNDYTITVPVNGAIRFYRAVPN